jgi:hypothetical protein
LKERHWNNLVGSLRHGQCVLMLGADLPVRRQLSSGGAGGGSEGAGNEDSTIPEQLRLALAQELEEDGRRPSGATLSAIAQYYEDTEGFGSSSLRAAAERLIQSKQYCPSTVHEKLAALPFSLIMTTAHDSLMSQALVSAGKSPIAQQYHMRGDKRDNPEFLIPGTPTTPVIYHLFGSAAQPWSMVLSENDALDFLIRVVSERPPLPNSLLRALKRDGQSFLFVGFGIRRWDLRVLLKVLLRALELNRSGPSIVAESLSSLVQADREETILFYQRGTRVEVEDEDIPTFLTKLAGRLEVEGGYLEQAALPMGTRPRVFISYAREDGDLAMRVYEALQAAGIEPWLDRQSLEGGDDWNQRIEADLDNSHFVVVLYTQALARKHDSYVNKELALASERALRVRGPFLIPLRYGDLAGEDKVELLRKYDNVDIHDESFAEDMAKVISTIKREYQRRNR